MRHYTVFLLHCSYSSRKKEEKYTQLQSERCSSKVSQPPHPPPPADDSVLMGLELTEEACLKINRQITRAAWKTVKVGLSPLKFRDDLATHWVEVVNTSNVHRDVNVYETVPEINFVLQSNLPSEIVYWVILYIYVAIFVLWPSKHSLTFWLYQILTLNHLNYHFGQLWTLTYKIKLTFKTKIAKWLCIEHQVVMCQNSSLYKSRQECKKFQTWYFLIFQFKDEGLSCNICFYQQTVWLYAQSLTSTANAMKNLCFKTYFRQWIQISKSYRSLLCLD